MRHAWLLIATLGCGVEVVELAPEEGDVLVVGDVPRDVIARFAVGEPEPDPKMLALRDPSDGVALPANVAPIRFAWDADKPMTAFELRLAAGERTLRVYTREPSVTLPPERWSALLQGDALTVELRALDTMGMGMGMAPPMGGKRMLRRGEPRTIAIRPALNGTLSFASMTQAERARVSDTVSEEGELARAQGAVLAGRVARVGPDGVELDGRVITLPAGARVAHPSWSTDGASLLLTYWPPELNATRDDQEGSQLARLSLDGALTVLKVDGADNPRRPRLAPNARWLAFEGGKPNDPELYLVAADGGAAKALRCGERAPSRAPAWLGDTWLGFVSTRPHLDPPRAQVWVAELMPEEVRCAAPFHWPAQDAQRDYEALWFERE